MGGISGWLRLTFHLYDLAQHQRNASPYISFSEHSHAVVGKDESKMAGNKAGSKGDKDHEIFPTPYFMNKPASQKHDVQSLSRGFCVRSDDEGYKHDICSGHDLSLTVQAKDSSYQKFKAFLLGRQKS